MIISSGAELQRQYLFKCSIMRTDDDTMDEDEDFQITKTENKASVSLSPEEIVDPDLPFANGAVRQTALEGQPRNRDTDITIDEVLDAVSVFFPQHQL